MDVRSNLAFDPRISDRDQGPSGCRTYCSIRYSRWETSRYSIRGAVNSPGQVKAPTLVIRGDLDTQVPEGDISALLRDLIAPQQKVFVHVACASHYLVWENQHMILLRASEEWLKHGTFAGKANGSFAVDSDGRVHREQ
jgi:pimeloyl-ACP methyl ester carboxylesterase